MTSQPGEREDHFYREDNKNCRARKPARSTHRTAVINMAVFVSEDNILIETITLGKGISSEIGCVDMRFL